MPQSKSRKKRIAEQRRNIVRARRRLEREHEIHVKNSVSEQAQDRAINIGDVCFIEEVTASNTVQQIEVDKENLGNTNDGRSLWFGLSSITNLYSWCQYSLNQVILELAGCVLHTYLKNCVNFIPFSLHLSFKGCGIG